MKVTSIYLVSGGRSSGKVELKAFFDVREGVFLIKGFKLLKGNDGLFVGMPSKPSNNPKSEYKYEDIVRFAKKEDKDSRDDLLRMAIAAYKAKRDEDDSGGSSSRRSNERSRRRNDDDDGDDQPRGKRKADDNDEPSDDGGSRSRRYDQRQDEEDDMPF